MLGFFSSINVSLNWLTCQNHFRWMPFLTQQSMMQHVCVCRGGEHMIEPEVVTTDTHITRALSKAIGSRALNIPNRCETWRSCAAATRRTRSSPKRFHRLIPRCCGATVATNNFAGMHAFSLQDWREKVENKLFTHYRNITHSWN